MTSKELVPLNEELPPTEVHPDLEDSKTENRKMIIGVCITIFSAFCYVTGLAAFQRIRDSPPDFQLNFVRYVVGLILITAGLCTKGMVPKVPLQNVKWLPLAGAGYLSFQLLMYKNEVRFLPLGTVGSLFSGLLIRSLYSVKQRQS